MTSKTSTKPKAARKAKDGYVEVATTAEIPPGEHKVVEAGEESLVIFHVDDTFYALANICSHDNGPLGEGLCYDHEIMCPRHGARFDFRTGKVLSFPAIVDVPAYSVKVESDRILVKLTSGE
jgi:3-phenylpropionate/trans-cinnamate dioxygenase ferredoxin component